MSVSDLSGRLLRAQHRPLAAVVVEQRVDRLLQHPLFVADDDFRRVEVDQLLQPVVAVDDAAVQVVQVAGGEVARIQQHQRAQVRRDHRDHVQHHPLGLVVAVADRFDDLQPVDQVLRLLLRAGLGQLGAQVLARACTRSSSISSLRTASAPMSASNEPSPYCSRAARYSSSVSSCCFFERRVARVGRPRSPGSRSPFPGWWSSCPAGCPGGWAWP